ncbi:hypothetical protein QM298_22655 [Pseudomonas mendocina]|nr:hypothetical protein [Pseudomonas mendocina]MDV5863626.1 hypothetical protein [Pseudomonas mendocina]
MPSPFGRYQRSALLPSPFGRYQRSALLPSPFGRYQRSALLPSPFGRYQRQRPAAESLRALPAPAALLPSRSAVVTDMGIAVGL